MPQLVSEHYYAGIGIMRPVLCAPGVVRVRFALDGADGDIQVSYDPPANIKKGRAQWLTHLGGSAGESGEISALRVVLRQVEGWAKLTVVEVKNDEGNKHG